ncbi:MAG: T9SS type A sorting domain-containing protein [Bacteroidales bacterium]|nr:T9SS type A sorting domain-containing protein [Bacteroidales bacterium]
MKSKLALFVLMTLVLKGMAQEPNVLFIGNSYTEVNNLPQMVYNVARSMGDSMTFASNTPGGCTFMQHCSNHSMEMIRQGGWDVVVLQEQSQYPSFPQSQVENEVFPYAERLIDSIYAHNPCAEPMFYMTWGRKNGDAQNAQYFPVLGTYEGMDSMLCERYTYMANTFDASLCPVGRVWRYLRTNHREIELYQSDGSHPSLAGTYAAACTFYTLIFHRDPNQIIYNPGIDNEVARTIRNAVHIVAYDNLTQWRRTEPTANIGILRIDNNTSWFTYECTYADSLIWQFGDGTDTTTSPAESQDIHHTYADTGHYIVTLTAQRHCMRTTDTIEITIQSTAEVGIDLTPENGTKIYPNPAHDYLTVSTPTSANITIANSAGKIVLRGQINPGENLLQLNNLPGGAYTLIMSTHNSTHYHTLIIK